MGNNSMEVDRRATSKEVRDTVRDEKMTGAVKNISSVSHETDSVGEAIHRLKKKHPEGRFCRGRILVQARLVKKDPGIVNTDYFIDATACHGKSCDKFDHGKCSMKEMVEGEKYRESKTPSLIPTDYNPDSPDWIYKFWDDNSFGTIGICTTALRYLLSMWPLLNFDEQQFVFWRLIRENPIAYKSLVKQCEPPKTDYDHIENGCRPCLEDGKLKHPDWCVHSCDQFPKWPGCPGLQSMLNSPNWDIIKVEGKWEWMIK